MTALAAIRYMLAITIDGYFDRAARFDRTRLGRVFLLDVHAFAPLLAILILIYPPRVLRRALAAATPAVRRLCLVDVPSMARQRRSQSAPARSRAAQDEAAAAGLARALDRVRRVAARLLDALGAIATTSQPRLAAALVARSAANSAA